MRPALLRLLKRPSAVSVLDSLTATPIGIEHLGPRYMRLRCQSRCANQEYTIDDTHGGFANHVDSSPSQTADEGRPFSFTVHEIEAPKESRVSRSLKDPALSETAHVIKSLQLQPERLEFESDVGHTKDLGTRLIDNPEYGHNFGLWEELLRFRQRHYGDKGTQDIWEGLTMRLNDVRLPVTGDHADFLWQSFVDMGLKRPLLLKDVMEYAIYLHNTTGNSWLHLYEGIVGGFLAQGKNTHAHKSHLTLLKHGLAGPNDVVRVLRHTISASSVPTVMTDLNQDAPYPSSQSRLKGFLKICRGSKGHQIYGSAIATILQHGVGEDALFLHNFLVGGGDHPKTIQDIQPLVQFANKYGRDDEIESLRAYVKQRFDTELDQEPGDSKRTKEGKHFKDDIAARLFATRALNFDMVLGGLKMLGVSAIGPRTLRELASRANGSQDVLAKLKMLRQAGISIGDSVFSRLVQKLAQQNRGILLADLLQSDQHPDVLGDTRTQESFLVSYYMARDWSQYNMSLAILNELCPDPLDLLDIHFRKHIAAGELSAASKVVDELALRGKALSEDSIRFMASQVLTRRRPGHRPRLSPGKALRTDREVMFIFHVLQRVVPLGGYVQPALWVELLKRLGMENYWNELRECCLWLVQQYGSSPSKKPWEPAQSSKLAGSPQDGRILKLIFTIPMQRAIASWGFIFPVTSETESNAIYVHPTTGEKFIPWVRGITLLRELEQAGLHLHKYYILQATRTRMAMVFGRYNHSQERMNRMLRRQNPYSLHRVAGEILRAWGDPTWFHGIEPSHLERLVNPRRTAGSYRRSARVILPRRRSR
ncbi:hypothetical protein N7462_002614 [Penicillium macrosclerotiorum]|uniref:uncharacterized protein n=1 Tax=Penicillium macrosclerotiorum TaxID=303699 RepID=UPI00254735F5|nr:uncharacterized protein N7462_002614 [Penicillium macrosclerotiorum]KAJ5693191.1 hypothetical protein N7462_002614 [Penicillium macrosclerotiorum]